MAMRNFRDLEVWVLGKEVSREIYTATRSFPKEEIYGITSQMRRASISVPSNIAEGSSRHSNKDFTRFLEIAIGSCFELETQVIICQELGYLDEAISGSLLEKLTLLEQKINSFIQSVKKFQ